MYNLSNEEKRKIIVTIVSENRLTAYEIGKKTKLSVSGVEKILEGITKKPQEKTLNKILKYLESIHLLEKEKGKSTQNLVQEELTTGYSTKIQQLQERITEHNEIIKISKDASTIDHQNEIIKLLKTQISIIEEAEKNHNLD